jgi:type II secretory pathway predicted ATPase ExeA
MYESFFGLDSKPFSMLPDPDFLYLGKKHRYALTMLEYTLMNNAGFCVITGEIGAGKTTLLRKLLANLEDDTAIGMITNTHQSLGDLLEWVLSAFGMHEPGLSKVEMHQRFVDFLLKQYAENRTTLLIVDEAQNLPATTLEELRMLSNINAEKDLLLQVILAGQPELKEKLRKPELKQFAQRIAVDFHLDALNVVEVCHYIQHRLMSSGAKDDIFTPGACQLLAEYSGGVPRLINMFCDTALVYAFADQSRTIDADLVEEVITERMETSILPLVRADQPANAPRMHDDDFPWINPKRKKRKGLKPATQKKTKDKTVAASNDAKEASTIGRIARTIEDPVNVPAVGTIGQPENQARPQVAATGTGGEKSKPKPQKWAPTTARELGGDQAAVDFADSGLNFSAPVRDFSGFGDDMAERSQSGNRSILFVVLVLALILSVTAATSDYWKQVPGVSGLLQQQAEVVELGRDWLNSRLSAD